MEKVCPVCNEIYMEAFECSRCGGIMIDKGRVNEFVDSYGAEMPVTDSEEYCFHIFKCEGCGSLQRKDILKVII